jgi:hypothetical protein
MSREGWKPHDIDIFRSQHRRYLGGIKRTVIIHDQPQEEIGIAEMLAQYGRKI